MLAIVGCGFVGSIFVDEFLKRQYAGKIPLNWLLIDSDEVEPRNAANQNFQLTDAGRAKAVVMQDRVQAAGRIGLVRQVRVDVTNIQTVLPSEVDTDLWGGDPHLERLALIVDAVDNLETRQLLWSHGLSLGVPVLHLGISEMGTGKVEWSFPEHDTFSLSPRHTAGKEIIDPPSGVTPPCELARMRGVGLNTSFAAAVAAAIYFGFDPESHLNGIATAGWMTDWQATPSGYLPLNETWEKVNEPHTVAELALEPAE